MRLIRDLEKRWDEEARYRPLRAVMSLERDGLVLGAGTVLAERDRDEPDSQRLAPDTDAIRLLSLLSVAYDRQISPSVLGNIRRATRQWERGEDCLAAIHLAFTGLPKLDAGREAARRLFIADGLIEGGIAPQTILQALDIDTAPLQGLLKFDPGQPRVPPGNGIFSGRWVAELGEVLTNLSGSAVARLATAVVRYGRGLGYQALLIPTPAGGRGQSGSIPGMPGFSYAWNDDETELDIIHTEGDFRGIAFSAQLGPDGVFRDQQNRAVAQLVRDKVVIDTESLSEPVRSPSKTNPDAISAAWKPRRASVTRITRITSNARSTPATQPCGAWATLCSISHATRLSSSMTASTQPERW